MKFTYNGGEDKQNGTVFAGRTWKIGTPLDIADAHSLALIKAHPHFDSDGKEAAPVIASPTLVTAFSEPAPAPPEPVPEIPGVVDPNSLSEEELERLTAPEGAPEGDAEPKRRGRPVGSKNRPKE